MVSRRCFGCSVGETHAWGSAVAPRGRVEIPGDPLWRVPVPVGGAAAAPGVWGPQRGVLHGFYMVFA